MKFQINLQFLGKMNEIINNTTESMVKHKIISREFLLVQENIKEKNNMTFLLKQYNSILGTLNNKHKRFIFKIYFEVVYFFCNYQYFSLHVWAPYTDSVHIRSVGHPVL